MICNQLETYWKMVKTMRTSPDPELRECGVRWVKAKATTLTDCHILNKAIGYAVKSVALKSKLRS